MCNCYNFNEVIDRKNTSSLKYDSAVHRGKPEQVLPLWVADMDFQTAPEILDEVKEKVEHGIFGYSEPNETYFEALQDWMREHHDWSIEKNWLVKTPGVVFALALAVRTFTKEGDTVLIQSPVYYPFREVVESNHRIVADNTLVLGENGKYQMNYEDFEHQIVEHKIRLFLLCNPHNPVGRVWTAEELRRIGDICLRHHVIVVSDEIHCDFVLTGHKHQVFANLSPELANITITCTSPSKTFNLAGLQVSNILIANQQLKKQFQIELNASGYSQLNIMGLTACEAAYQYGERWHKALMVYLQDNLSYVKTFLRTHLPQIKLIEPEGTYLIWLDFRGLGLSENKREALITEQAKLWLDSGVMFGESGEGFERMNIACPRSTLREALERLALAIIS
jgi:cystathionine beta-lyase